MIKGTGETRSTKSLLQLQRGALIIAMWGSSFAFSYIKAEISYTFEFSSFPRKDYT